MVSEAPVAADDAFRVRRVDTLRRRRASRGRWGWRAWVMGALLLLVATLVTVSRSQPNDHLERLANAPKMVAAAGPRQGGTGCVGWPLSLTPTERPATRAGAVTLWGDRDAFHLHNATSGKVTIDVVPQGAPGATNVGQTVVVADRLRLAVPPAAEATFTLACGATGMLVSGTDAAGSPLGADAFQMGTGPASAPLQLTKARQS